MGSLDGSFGRINFPQAGSWGESTIEVTVDAEIVDQVRCRVLPGAGGPPPYLHEEVESAVGARS